MFAVAADFDTSPRPAATPSPWVAAGIRAAAGSSPNSTGWPGCRWRRRAKAAQGPPGVSGPADGAAPLAGLSEGGGRGRGLASRGEGRRRRPIAAGDHGHPVWMSEFACHLEARLRVDHHGRRHTVLVTLHQRLSTTAPGGWTWRGVRCPTPGCWRSWPAGPRHWAATGVLVLPNHHPVMLVGAPPPSISGGRLRLCVGWGWLRGGDQALRGGVRQPRAAGRRADRGAVGAVGRTTRRGQPPRRVLRP